MLVLSAGIDIDIYSAADNFVTAINAQQLTLCTRPAPQRPLFCAAPPLGGSLVCTVNEYSPTSVYQCPNAAVQLAVTFGNPNCNCTVLPNTPTYNRNLLSYIQNIVAFESLSVAPSVPFGICNQADVSGLLRAGGLAAQTQCRLAGLHLCVGCGRAS